MIRYVAARLISAVPVLALISLVAFALLQLIPGDAASVIAGDTATPAQIAEVRAALGLDQPWYVQLGRWYAGILSGDLGTSHLLRISVGTAIAERLPVTVSLTLCALAITVPFGLAAGILAALRPNSWVDFTLMGASLIGISLPGFWLGLIAIFLFAVDLKWLPVGGYAPLDAGVIPWLKSLAMPAVCLGLFQVGLLARITRATMLETLRQDFVRTARAKGLGEWLVIGKHALMNVMIPVMTVIGIIVSLMAAGAVVIEQVFSLPGIGRLMTNAILGRDYPVIQGTLLFAAAAMVAINVAVDVLYAWFDPRIRHD
jgi:peptide/nickel transport system permease protein